MPFNAIKNESPVLSNINSADRIISISFPRHPNIRSRKIVSRSKARPTGKYPSWKMNRMVQWESENELNAFRILDAHPWANTFLEQPAEIKFFLNGENHTHYPDILVLSNLSKEIWEVKPNSALGKEDVACRTDFLSKNLLRYGYHYRLIIEEKLIAGPYLKNALLLLRLGRRPVDLVSRERVRLLMQDEKTITWGNLHRGQYGADLIPTVCRLLLDGTLSWDINFPINEYTSIQLAIKPHLSPTIF